MSSQLFLPFLLSLEMYIWEKHEFVGSDILELGGMKQLVGELFTNFVLSKCR